MIVELTYKISPIIVLDFTFEEHGDLKSFYVNGVDRSDSGDAIEAGLVAVAEAGHDLQKDISIAFAKLMCERPSKFRDPDYIYESSRDSLLIARAEGE